MNSNDAAVNSHLITIISIGKDVVVSEVTTQFHAGDKHFADTDITPGITFVLYTNLNA